jgi:hypothetical protein
MLHFGQAGRDILAMCALFRKHCRFLLSVKSAEAALAAASYAPTAAIGASVSRPIPKSLRGDKCKCLIVGRLDEKLAASILPGRDAPIMLEAPLDPLIALGLRHVAKGSVEIITHCRFSVGLN